MEATAWITVQGQKKWGRWHGRITGLRAKKPATKRDEIAIKLRLDLPDSLFERPQLEACITVPEEQAGSIDISADVQENLSEVLSNQLGVHVHVTSEPAQIREVCDGCGHEFEAGTFAHKTSDGQTLCNGCYTEGEP